MLSMFTLAGCASTYYKAMDSIGFEKRDILVDRVEDARDAQLMTAMRKAEQAMPPVLSAFRDQVLVLKHNLNARAIGALRNELGNIERDTANLIAEMQKAINEANSFIASME
ncbi:MAG: hypothetical protein ACI9H8_002167 [Lysobacterales bacterium]